MITINKAWVQNTNKNWKIYCMVLICLLNHNNNSTDLHGITNNECLLLHHKLMTQVVDFFLHFLDKHNIKHDYLFLWERGSGLWRLHLQYMTSIMPTHFSHPISCTDSELALIIWPRFTWTVLTWPTGARNPSMDSPYPDQSERKTPMDSP